MKHHLIALFCIFLMVTLPGVDALSTSNIHVTDVSDTNAVVRFDADQKTAAEVKFGLDADNLDQSVIRNTFRDKHSFALTDLLPNTNYFFEVVLRAGNERFVDDNNGVKHVFRTSLTDSTPPRIGLNIPTSYNKLNIDLIGETEANAAVTLQVNNVNVDADIAYDGMFRFVGVSLEPATTNTLVISATDSAGLTNQKQFSVAVDVVAPVINLTTLLPALLAVDSFGLSGSLSETANLSVTVNDDVQFNELVTGDFSTTLNFVEGENSVVIFVVDSSGNEREIIQTVRSDTQPPEINNVQPLEDNPFYFEGRAIDDISGETEPGAQVYLYIVPSQFYSDVTDLSAEEIINKSQQKTVADPDGIFEFDDVNFQFPFPSDIKQIAPREISASEIQTGSGEIIDRPLRVFIAVIDSVGNSNKENYDLRIGSCFSGDFDFSVRHMPEQQFPTMLSPDRLDGGFEAISFVLGMEYNGRASYNRLNLSSGDRTVDDDWWEVVDVQLDPACRRGEIRKTDDSYDIACQLLGGGKGISQEINVERTNWYFKYNLGSSSEFTEFSPEFWKTFANSEIKFPFKVHVTYAEKPAGRSEETKKQMVCRDVGYFVDVPIDPREVLPDFLLEDSMEIVNDTIQIINEIEPILDEIIQYVGVGCVASFALRFVVQFYRRFTEKWELNSCKLQQATDDTVVCPGGKMKNSAGEEITAPALEHWWIANDEEKPPGPDAGVYEGTSSKFSAGYYQNLRLDSPQMTATFSGTINTWETEETLYKAYRFLCDRVFCHAAPAAWTQTKSLKEITQKKYEERSCDAEDSGSVRNLQKIDNCYQELGVKEKIITVARDEIDGNVCYSLGGGYYIVKPDPGKPLKCPGGAYYLERIDNLKIESSKTAPQNLCAVDRKNGNYYTADTRKCEQVCQIPGEKWASKCAINDGPEVQGWYAAGYTSDCWYGDPSNFDPVKHQCFCEKSIEKELMNEKQKVESRGARFAGCEETEEGSGETAEGETPTAKSGSDMEMEHGTMASGGAVYSTENTFGFLMKESASSSPGLITGMQTAATYKYELTWTGGVCGGCPNLVKTKISEITGVTSVTVVSEESGGTGGVLTIQSSKTLTSANIQTALDEGSAQMGMGANFQIAEFKQIPAPTPTTRTVIFTGKLESFCGMVFIEPKPKVMVHSGTNKFETDANLDGSFTITAQNVPSATTNVMLMVPEGAKCSMGTHNGYTKTISLSSGATSHNFGKIKLEKKALPTPTPTPPTTTAPPLISSPTSQQLKGAPADSTIKIDDTTYIKMGEMWMTEDHSKTATDEDLKSATNLQSPSGDTGDMVGDMNMTGTSGMKMTAPDDCKEDKDKGWEWSYREQQLYRENNGQGTYYPKERYYDDRDFWAAFGLNHLFDYLPGEKTITEVNPFTQHIGAVQAVCLTGIRARLQMIKSILVGYNACLEQIKITGKADAGICKELFTQYICNLASKVLSYADSGCLSDSFGQDQKEEDDDDNDLSKLVKFASTAISDTVDSSVSDLESEYGNAKLDNFLEGGTESLTTKICLAAFGIDSGLDMNTFFDAAYSVPFKTSASVFSSEGALGRREFLGFNPQTFAPRYEYRAAWAIFPGCPLESYDIDLVAVTESERREFDNVDCGAVNNYEYGSNGCDNLHSSSIRPFSLFRGNRVEQSQIIDENKALIIEEPYRYDHVRIRLNLEPDWKVEKCIPKENIQGNSGVFYFPIKDATARDVVQCNVDTPSGRFFCSAFDLQGIGQAWMEDVTCWDSSRQQYARCDSVVHTVAGSDPDNPGKGDPIRVQAKVFTSGTKMCLQGHVKTSRSGVYPDPLKWWPIIGLGQPHSLTMEMELVDELEADMLAGKTEVSIDPETRLVKNIISTPTHNIGPFDVYFGRPATNTPNSGATFGAVQDGDYYSVGPSDWKKIETVAGKHIITIKHPGKSGELKIEVKSVDLHLSDVTNKKVGNVDLYTTIDEKGISDDQDAPGTIAYDSIKIGFNTPAGSQNQEQNWNVEVGLYYPNDRDECMGKLVPVRVPPQVAFVPKKNIPISVRNERIQTEDERAYNDALAKFNKAFDNNYRKDLIDAADMMIKIRTRDWREVHATYWYVIAYLTYVERENPQDPQPFYDKIKPVISNFLQDYRGLSRFLKEDGAHFRSEAEYPTDYKVIKEYLNATQESGILG